MQFEERGSAAWGAEEAYGTAGALSAPQISYRTPDSFRVQDGDREAPAFDPRVRSFATETAIRTFDVVFAVGFFLAAFPVLLILAIALQLDSPGKLFFSQSRIGRNGELFRCFKFRTMCENADEVLARHLEACPTARAEWDADFKLRNDPRITRLGAIARKFSLDEFPQLWNILKGDMSVVGPRP
ncbi:MAG: sugar transferase, partial [Sandaracinobacteroides sp.]